MLMPSSPENTAPISRMAWGAFSQSATTAAGRSPQVEGEEGKVDATERFGDVPERGFADPIFPESPLPVRRLKRAAIEREAERDISPP